jgi:glycosyltransferase involved in cell wall biosynthesis
VKVAVLNNSVPFLKGGAEHLADSLVAQLKQRGHQAELVRVPLRWATPTDVAESMFAASTLRIPEADVVIPLKFPAYLVQHPRKNVWLLHQFRQVYDLWEVPGHSPEVNRQTLELRDAIRAADGTALGEANRLFSNSAVTAARLAEHNGLKAEVLLPPHGDAGQFSHRSYGNYVLAIGRINAAKRQHLLIPALANSRSSLRLVIAGAPEGPEDLALLEDLVRRHGVQDRVQIIPEFIDDETKARLLSEARAVAYLPLDEDSYGYVTAEGMYSRKPVITLHDAGGILQLVEDGVTGLVRSADPADLGTAFDVLDDVRTAERLGAAALDRVTALRLSWDHVISELLA